MPRWATGFINSLKVAAGTAVFGTAAGFHQRLHDGEDARAWTALRGLVRLLAMLPMAVPGLVLGLGYIFFLQQTPANPLNGLYQTLALMTLCTIVHFYTTGPSHGRDRTEERWTASSNPSRPRSRYLSTPPSGASPCPSAPRRWWTSRAIFSSTR